MDRQPAIVGGVGHTPSSCRGALELRDVSFRYPGATDMVSGVVRGVGRGVVRGVGRGVGRGVVRGVVGCTKGW